MLVYFFNPGGGKVVYVLDPFKVFFSHDLD